MTKEEKERLVAEVMEGFDFKMVFSILYLKGMDNNKWMTIDHLEFIAEKLLYMALKHQDREFWWAGGMHRGGLCACYDDKWGLSLNYIAVANKVRISKDKEL